MTWFIELQNRFNESRLFKTLMIYVLNWVDDLISWQLISIFLFSLQSYRKFSAKFILKLFEFDLIFKDNHMIVFCILHQAQFKVFTFALIDNKVFAYVFMNKFFMQQHHFFLHQ